MPTRQRNDHGQSGPHWIAAVGPVLAGVAALLGVFLTQHKDSPTINIDNHATLNNRVASAPTPTPSPAAVASSPTPVSSPAPAVITPTPARPHAALPSDYDKYIDPRAPRQPGKMNVAIAIQGLTGEELEPLEDAMRQGLTEGGNSVTPLFRERFRIDGLGKKLFDGDPTLAGKLKLRDHCDAVLVATLRFVGPATAINGLYIREIVLDVHQIDPVSGQIDKSLQIREKGGGADPQLSTANALSRLKDSIETSISEWTWT